MSKRSLWAGIAGAANAFQQQLLAQQEYERKSKLYMMEQDILQKRQEALAGVRADLQDRNAANRSGRAMDRDAYKKALGEGDVVGQFRDEETGDMYGRRKDGSTVPLMITSDEYKEGLKKLQNAKIATQEATTPLRQAQTERTQAQTGNIQSQTTRRDATPIADPEGDKIRGAFTAGINQRRAEAIKAAEQAKKAGEQGQAFDPMQAAADVQSQLYATYGADAVKNALGSNNQSHASPTQGQMPPKPTPQAAPAGNQPQVTPDMIIAKMNEAIKAGKDPQAVQQWGQSLFKQYGLDPQAGDTAQ